MKLIPGTKIRAIENYESKKERWLLQVAADSELPAGALRVAIGIALHMNRKQRLLAWPGFGRLQKLLGIHRDTVRRGVKALERAGHMRIVRSRSGGKNHPNHYHPNIWRTEVGAATHPGRCTDAPWVGAGLHPEPMNEPMREPTIRGREEESKIGGLGRGEGLNSIGQPKLPRSTPVVEEITGTAEANLITVDYAAALGSFRPVVSRFDRSR